MLFDPCMVRLNYFMDQTAETDILTISVYRRSFLSHAVKPARILLDGMETGWCTDGRFHAGAKADDRLTAWHKDHIGRGITIRWDPKDIRFTGLSLKLPAPEEELDDFFLMTARLARQDISEVLLNGEAFAPKQYYDRKEEWKTWNLRLLHSCMNEVLNGEDACLELDGVFRRLYAGMEEAETMWAGVHTETFRDWLHSTQNPDDFYAAYEDTGYQDRLELPIGKTAVLIEHPQNSNCRLADGRTVPDFLKALGNQKLTRLDARTVRTVPLTAEMLKTDGEAVSHE